MKKSREGSASKSLHKREQQTPAANEAAEYTRPNTSTGTIVEGFGLYRLLVESVRDYAIFALDPEGHVLSWNLGAERLKGYTADEIIGKHFSIFYPDAEKESKPVWELEVAAAEGRVEDENWRIRKDGTRFWANVVITALRDEAGVLVGFAKVTRDLTERKASEERAIADARRLAEVQAANKAKSEFLAAMSHELRTPLNAIGGYAELMEMGVAGEVNDQQKAFLKRIRGGQQHLLAIINDLLNYSRIEAGQITYEMEPVELRSLVERVLSMVEPQAIVKRLKLVHGPCPHGLKAWADRLKVEQVLINLLSNAVKFTPEEGEVTATCAASGNEVRITVSDTGPGIPEDKLEAVFEPFVQVGRSLTSAHEGTGLGLPISRFLARAMDGDVTVTSVTGEGSSFVLKLRRA
jgi:PAS domain S-box-containing protein